jgi:hypothetical protein
MDELLRMAALCAGSRETATSRTQTLLSSKNRDNSLRL